MRYLLFLCVIMLGPAQAAPQKTCSYHTYKWNTLTRRAVAMERVEKPYRDLLPEEVDPQTGCSVCEQDQVAIRLGSLPEFRVCRAFAEGLRTELSKLLAAGFPIYRIEGYRAGRTRGPADAAGNRTQFSNHSYGIAIDINPEHNGLYEHCISFGPSCRLIRGGPWDPAKYRESLTSQGEIVQAMRRLGLLWGGAIEGRQKDFMHFSPGGY
ncbi:MAG TPA: M15 family metallopeptidase [Gammaproteobacteria bacterium]|nr:M15 family metallopeptidase [Gammaproteobacteria bacterium]